MIHRTGDNVIMNLGQCSFAVRYPVGKNRSPALTSTQRAASLHLNHTRIELGDVRIIRGNLDTMGNDLSGCNRIDNAVDP